MNQTEDAVVSLYMNSKILILLAFVFLAFSSCAQNTKDIPAGDPKPLKGEATAYFAEGCFWHTEIVFQSLYGVRDAVSGYAGGTTLNPTYDHLHGSGHAETVKVIYDPSKISFKTLVDAFFASHDPTQIDRQGNDVGPQYRSIAFYSSEEEKNVIEAAIRRLTLEKKYSKVATQVLQIKKFYAAENYHQEYILNNPGNPYVRNVSLPDYYHFRKTFKGKFKS